MTRIPPTYRAPERGPTRRLTMHVRVEAVTHRGCVRERNEDTLGVAGWLSNAWSGVPAAMWFRVSEPAMVVLADGMGGQPGGDVASAAAVREMLSGAGEAYAEQPLHDLVLRADAAVRLCERQDASLKGLGTTIAGLVLLPTRAIAFNVGDSRIFRLQDGYLGQVSVDDRGRRLPGQPADAQIHTLTQCLGGGAQTPEPHLLPIDLTPGDRFLVCSDGMSDVLDSNRIVKILDEFPQEPVAALLATVLSRGAPDNVSIVLVDIGQYEDAPAEERASASTLWAR